MPTVSKNLLAETLLACMHADKTKREAAEAVKRYMATDPKEGNR